MTDSEILYEYCKARFPNDPYEDIEYRTAMGKTLSFSGYILTFKFKEMVKNISGNIKSRGDLLYPLPCIELLFCRCDPDNSRPGVIGSIDKPHNKCSVYIAFLFWGKRFSFYYRKFK